MVKHLKTLALASSALSIGIAAPAFADTVDDNKVLQDSWGKPVYSTYDNCVRTEWETPNNMDPCAPPPEPKPIARVMSPAHSLEKEERRITFEFDSAQLDEDAKAKLDNLATTLSSSADVKHASIVGFADRIGESNYNEELSAKRASSVKDYLAERGYINTRLAEIRGLGESNSVTTCDDKESREALIDCLRPDRRVEVEVTFTEPKSASMRQSISSYSK